MDYDTTLDILTQIQRAFFDAGNKLIDDFPEWNRMTDERVTVFLKCCNVISNVKLGLVFAHEHLSETEWWSCFPRFHNGVDNHPNRAAEFGIFMRVSFILSVFSLQEAALRRYLRSIDPKACSGSSGPFARIYDELFKQLKSIPEDSKARYIELLDLFREIRNSIHNNMVYYQHSGNSKIAKYRGNIYDFGVDQPLGFIDWQFLLLIATDIGSMLVDIVRCPEVQAAKEVFGPANFELAKQTD